MFTKSKVLTNCSRYTVNQLTKNKDKKRKFLTNQIIHTDTDKVEVYLTKK